LFFKKDKLSMFKKLNKFRAVSSIVEYCIDIAGVVGA
tara:strand:- start:9134 stop:9244 length:111 start_codon:yes stop_codon:yes gene_type:complete